MINKLVFENLKHRPVRTALSTLAIGIEVTMMLTLVGISNGMLEESARRARGVGADIVVRPPGSSFLSLSSAPIDARLAGNLEKQPHVTMVAGAIVHSLPALNSITGIDLNEFNRMSGGFNYIEGGPFKNPDDILVDRFYAQQYNLKVGSKINLIGHDWRVSGIIEEGKLARLVLPRHILQDLTSNTGKLSQIYLKVDRPENIAGVIADLKQKLPRYPIYDMQELTSYLSVNNVPGLKAFISVVVGLSIVVGFLVVFLSMYTSVLERTREIGILKALGASPQFVLNVLFRETAILALVGAVIGIILTYGSRWLIMTLVPGNLTQKIVPDWWPIAAGIALAGALLGAAYPGLRAARQDPIEALSYE